MKCSTAAPSGDWNMGHWRWWLGNLNSDDQWPVPTSEKLRHQQLRALTQHLNWISDIYIYYNQLSLKSHGYTGIPKNIIPTAPSTLWKKYVMPIKSHEFQISIKSQYIYIYYNQLSLKSHGYTGIPKNIIPTAPSTLWKKYVMPIKSHEFQISIKSQF